MPESVLAPLPRFFYKLGVSPKGKGAGAKSQAFNLIRYLAENTADVNRALDRFLPSASTKPATIHKAMRYSLFAGGKRLRPTLCLAAAEACGGNSKNAMPLACAV